MPVDYPMPIFPTPAGWHFYFDGRLFGPYSSQETAGTRREEVQAYTADSPACHCRAVRQ